MINVLNEIYDRCSWKLSEFKSEPEGKAYAACQFKLNTRHIICRNAKTTPKKAGQFVFPKSIMIKKGIVSVPEKEGKRAFRVYPP